MTQKSQNICRVGDYVYFESSPGAPYQIRRIEELNKSQAGMEARVVCFFRRRDIPISLLKIADQAERQNQILTRPKMTLLLPRNEAAINGDAKNSKNTDEIDDQQKSDDKSEKGPFKTDNKYERSYGFAGLPSGSCDLSTEKIHQLRQHELFLSRQYEILDTNKIRGKCTVVILNEVETCDMYLGHEDAYFYSLVYDPVNQTLLADKGKIEIGSKTQANIPNLITDDADEKNIEDLNEQNIESTDAHCHRNDNEPAKFEVTDREQVVYHPYHSLTDRDIDQFLIIARAVGTFSRALDSNSGMKMLSLHMTASAASRDVTLLHAMALLHHANYDIGQATKFLVPPPNKNCYPLEADKTTGHNTVNLGGPILCRDQLEEWSASEAALFDDAIDKFGKDFHDIRTDYLPWKSMRDIVEYYYMWKTTDRCAQKKPKTEDHKFKLVYVPLYNKPSPNLVTPANNTQPIKSPTPCEGCSSSESPQWYSWGPAPLHFRLCATCWTHWRKHGGLKHPHKFELYDLDGSFSLDSLGSGRTSSTRGHAHKSAGVATATGTRTNEPQIATHHTVNAKGQATFYLLSALEARIVRRIAPKSLFNMRKSARSPFKVIDMARLKAFYFSRTLIEILKVGQQVRQRTLSKWEGEHLTRLHQTHLLPQKKPPVLSACANGAGAGAGSSNTRRI